MIVGFSKHGKGKGAGPVNYCTDPSRPGRKENPPEVLRGNPDQTKAIIDGCTNKWKYTSGVLSFAPGETITPDMEKAIIDRFEQVAFAGLEEGQFDCLWVRHTHAGHHELHFVTPRLELESGKALNIKPPGKLAQDQFDDFRSEINERYGLADPTDPERARLVREPSLDLKMAAEALRSASEPPKRVKQALGEIIEQRAAAGLISDRKGLGDTLRELGFEVKRSGKDYVSVEGDGQRHRLKGEIYGKDFNWQNYAARGAAGEASRERERRNPGPSPERAKKYEARVEKHIAARAKYNAARYPGRSLGRDAAPTPLAERGRPEPLPEYGRRSLGRDCLARETDYEQFKIDYVATRNPGKTRKPRRENSIQQVRREPEAVRSGERERGHVRVGRRKLHDFEGVLSDGFGAVAQRLAERVISGAREAARRTAEFAKSLSQRIERERTIAQTSAALEQSSRELERNSGELSRTVKQIENEHSRAAAKHHSQGLSL